MATVCAAKPSSKVILLVENEPAFSHFTKVMLDELGYKVVRAQSGEEAVSIFGHLRQDVGLVILDTLMPGLSGRQTYSALRGIDGQVKVLLSGNHQVDDDITALLHDGCRGFIQKPYSLKGLARKVNSAMA